MNITIAIDFIKDNASLVIITALLIMWIFSLACFFTERAKYKRLQSQPDRGCLSRLADSAGLLGSWAFIIFPILATIFFTAMLLDPVGFSTKIWEMLQ